MILLHNDDLIKYRRILMWFVGISIVSKRKSCKQARRLHQFLIVAPIRTYICIIHNTAYNVLRHHTSASAPSKSTACVNFCCCCDCLFFQKAVYFVHDAIVKVCLCVHVCMCTMHAYFEFSYTCVRIWMWACIDQCFSKCLTIHMRCDWQ